MRNFFLLICVSSILFTSCRGIFGQRISGDGNIKMETRSAGQFNSVDVSGSMDLYVKQDADRSLKIEADENLFGYIEIINDGDKLVIRPKNGFNLKPSKDIKIYVSAPLFKRLEASGACDVYSENQITSAEEVAIGLSGSCDAKLDIKAPKISTEVSGACSAELKGETKDLYMEGSGSSDFKCFGLLAENVDVNISGAGDAEVSASVKLSVDVSGAAGVKYKGRPSLTQNISGAGSVKQVD